MPQGKSVYQIIRSVPLSKLFFYALVLLLPFNINRAYFTETSFFFGYHIFYHTIFIYLTDILICVLILSWLYEICVSQKHDPLPTSTRLGEAGNPPYFKGEEKPTMTPPLKVRGGCEGLFHKIYTSISQDVLIKSTMVFWLILGISITISQKPLLSFYGFVKISEFLLVFLYMKQNIRFTEIRTTLWLIVTGAVIQSVIGILQYFDQHSLGFQHFGETFFTSGMKGIAEFYTHSLISVKYLRFDEIMAGGKDFIPIIRPYGTFPHPNLLGAFLFVGLLASISLIYAKSRQTTPPPVSSPLKGEEFPSLAVSAEASGGGWEGRGRERVKSISREIFLALSLILISTGLTLTFSRTVWLVTVLALVILFILSRFHRNRVFARMETAQRETGNQFYLPGRLLVIILLLLIAFSTNWFLFGKQIKDRIYPPPREGARMGEVLDESIRDRQLFDSAAWREIKDNPVFGVGLRNFVVALAQIPSDNGMAEKYPRPFMDGKLLPHLHQPAHNIYLLLLAETGILGLGAFLWVLYGILKRGWGDRPARQSPDGSSRMAGGGQEKLILLTAFAGFLFLGFFDHYFLSLQQGSLLFWIVAGMLVSE